MLFIKNIGIGPLTRNSGAWKPDYCQCFKQENDFKVKELKQASTHLHHTLSNTLQHKSRTRTTSVDFHLNTAATESLKPTDVGSSNSRLFSVKWSRLEMVPCPNPHAPKHKYKLKKKVSQIHVYTYIQIEVAPKHWGHLTIYNASFLYMPRIKLF